MPDEADDELTDELRRLAARLDPVPPALLDTDEASLVRGAPERRLVSFTGGGLTIDVEVTSAGPERTVMGQIVPPQRGVVDIRRRQETVSIEADELGRFRSGPLPPGPLSLRLRPAGGAPVVTDWLAL